MAGRETADIVFCLDASGSMSHAIQGVKDNVFKLLEALKTSLQQNWDVRFDFLAYSNYDDNTMRLETFAYKGKEVIDAIYSPADPNGGKSCSLFTTDLNAFKDRLQNVQAYGNEASGLALDMCADFPFRNAANCHRVVVFLTDEACSTGLFYDKTSKLALKIAQKYQDRKIALFMTTPDCELYDVLSQIDKAEWTIDNSTGLANVDFSKMMESIGKSVSVSQTSISSINEAMPLFNENAWTSRNDDENVSVKFR